MLIKKILGICGLSLLLTAQAHAGVVMVKTRLIYPANSPSETLHLSNEDDFPYVVQVWTDNGDDKSTPKTADGPYLVSPPIFKMEPRSGQSVRLVYTGNNAPTDRESVAYVNFAQIPPSTEGENEMSVVVKHRLKVFYRPQKLPVNVERLSEHVVFEKHNKQVTLSNQSPYFLSLSAMKAVDAKGKEVILQHEMVAPYSSTVLMTRNGQKNLAIEPQKMVYNYVTDLGGIVSKQFSFTK